MRRISLLMRLVLLLLLPEVSTLMLLSSGRGKSRLSIREALSSRSEADEAWVNELELEERARRLETASKACHDLPAVACGSTADGAADG